MVQVLEEVLEHGNCSRQQRRIMYARSRQSLDTPKCAQTKCALFAPDAVAGFVDVVPVDEIVRGQATTLG